MQDLHHHNSKDRENKSDEVDDMDTNVDDDAKE